jgi:lysozyme
VNYSKDGLKLTEQFEGYRSEAYLDSGGVPTIGYGHTAGVKLGMKCNQAQAEAWLLEDLAEAERYVQRLVTVNLTQAEYDAVVDFAFNAGSGNLAHSTLLHKLNQGDYTGAAAEFERWDLCDGHVVAGLLRRRNAEAAEFEGSTAA